MGEELQAAVVSRTRILPVLLFTVGYLAAFFLAYFRSGNFEFLFYIAVLAVAVPLLWLLHRHVDLSTGVLWCLSCWGLFHMAGGLVPIPQGWPVHGESRVLYSLWIVPGKLRYDHLIHAYGFGVTTWVCWQALRHLLESQDRPIAPSFGKLTLCIAGGMGFGALNEVLEFFAVLLLPETNVGGYLNTGWDLVANLAGCLIAGLIIRLGGQKPSISPPLPSES